YFCPTFNIFSIFFSFFFFFQAEDGIRDFHVTGVQTCALPILACCLNCSTPSFMEMELTTHRPCTHLSPASMTDHFEESIMIGSRSEERRVGKECRSRWTPDQ